MNRSWLFPAGRRAAPRWLALLLVLLLPGAAAARPDPPRAELSVSGLGWLRNRELKLSLERLLGDTRGPELSASTVEDATFLLLSAVQAEGFLHPKIAVALEATGATTTHLIVDATTSTPVPRGLRARAVRFQVTPGVRYFVHRVTFAGLQAVPERLARSFFLSRAALFATQASRAHTPARLAQALDALQAEYRQLGYVEAAVTADRPIVDDRTGAVDLAVTVVAGPRWEVAHVHAEGAEGTGVAPEVGSSLVGHPWTDARAQELAGSWRTALYARGYADARVRVTRTAATARAGHKAVAVTVHVRPGAPVTLGPVRFEGASEMRAGVLQRRVAVTPGAPLDPLAVDRSRYRLARLGVFERVDLRYEPATGPVRCPVFTVRPGRSLETNLIFGYGSFEQARAAVELRQFNLFGRAHQSRLLLAQSMRSTRAEYAYTVPELLGESVDGTAKVFGLQREEIAFQRQEYGASAALSLPVRWLAAHATAGYTIQRLRNRDNELATRTQDDRQVTVASLDAGLTRDRRDNPLRPRRGTRGFAQAEVASRALGGEAEYQRLEFGGSWHAAWGEGRWVHAAVAHGVITTWGTSDRLLPVNKRFFPGGGSSIRGYREGEASPRGADGRFLGAKNYALVNLDLEQALAARWSVVAFGDALAAAAAMRDYPLAGDRLFSVGLGLRYQTLIGPVRVEYGRNLNPRSGDPGGTWQISVGAPF